MSLVQLCGHSTYLLLAISYIVRDIAWLRVISIPASICSVFFNYFAPTEPLWLIINWNLIFLTVNIYQLAKIRFDRQAIAMSDEMAEFASIVSPQLSASQSIEMFNQATHATVTGPNIFLTEGRAAQELMLVLEGSVEISQNGKRIGKCGSGTFIGEISFLTDENHTATVSIGCDKSVTVLSWDQTQLKSFAKSRPQFHVAIQKCLAANLSGKFTAMETSQGRPEVNEQAAVACDP